MLAVSIGGSSVRAEGLEVQSLFYESCLVGLFRGFFSASSYEGVWVYRASVPRGQRRRTGQFYDLDLEVM